MGRGGYFRSGRNSVTRAPGAALRRAVRVRAGTGRPGPRRPPGGFGPARIRGGRRRAVPGTGRPGGRPCGTRRGRSGAPAGTCPVGCSGAPPLGVPRNGNGTGRLRPRRAPAGRHRAGAGRTRSAGAPDRRGQARPGAGQRPGHSPGAVRRPGVWSRGARSAFADMSRSVSAAPAGVNPRPEPPNAPLAGFRVHPAHPLQPALFPALRPARGLTSTAEKRGRISWPRNAAATRSPGSAPAPRPRGPPPAQDCRRCAHTLHDSSRPPGTYPKAPAPRAAGP